MKTKGILAIISVMILAAMLTLATVVLARSQEKPYLEGLAGLSSSRFTNSIQDDKPYPEGEGYDSAGLRQAGDSETRLDQEGMAGKSGTGPLEQLDQFTANDLPIVYLFSGVSDDGEKGSSNRKEATSIHCTNVYTDNNQVEIQVYQWNGTDVFTGTVNMPPNRTFTFSTQNTTIYFDDVLLGGSPGTDAVFQGSGRVLAEHPQVICSAQVLDPVGYPPVFVSGLELYQP